MSDTPGPAIEYVPSGRRGRGLALLGVGLAVAASVMATASGAPYAGAVIVLAVVVVLVVLPALAFASVLVRVEVDPEAGAIHVETRRWLAPAVRRTLRPRAPRVEVDEYGTGAILLGSDEELVALTGVPPAEQDALRRRLRTAIEGWPAAPPEEVEDAASDPEEVRRDETRALIVAILHGDAELARGSLRRGADPDGHPEACGIGAPLFVARLRGDSTAEALLLQRGASRCDPDPEGRRALSLLARVAGLDELAERIDPP